MSGRPSIVKTVLNADWSAEMQTFCIVVTFFLVYSIIGENVNAEGKCEGLYL